MTLWTALVLFNLSFTLSTLHIALWNITDTINSASAWNWYTYLYQWLYNIRFTWPFFHLYLHFYFLRAILYNCPMLQNKLNFFLPINKYRELTICNNRITSFKISTGIFVLKVGKKFSANYAGIKAIFKWFCLCFWMQITVIKNNRGKLLLIFISFGHFFDFAERIEIPENTLRKRCAIFNSGKRFRGYLCSL